ncbi:hypothetical protein KVR01_006159 [Diaporthe batatas]|uniref:uncharacterized protein n=1 Tax=Diaporthe batatas TaxID=748121 RepID=UPI001D0529E3|nr:uncharacterized protein KVR01_006159 [Diaporthe batatas]KAG8164241.1 hypothetical protein KVR01_006159 [Diaporthe batatas]
MEQNPVTQSTSLDAVLDCEICDAIWSRLSGPDGNRTDPEIKLGSFEDALSTGCIRHKHLVEWFQRYCNEKDPASPFNTRPDRKDLGIRIRRPGSLTFTQSLEYGGLYADLLLMRRESVQHHPGIARALDPKWLDISAVNHWRNECASLHGASCENPTKIWPARPAWVVDTENRCLVPGKDCASYVTLSYRWGKARGLEIQQDTMAKLRRRNGLDDPSICSQLAPIVRHVISLASMIGERYLWVDVLCIDHSRVSESTRQLELMGAIYANASLTIVVFDVDAEEGLPGLQGVSRGRNRPDQLIPFGEENFVHDKHSYFEFSNWGDYHERGWTYQEFEMASKRLIFSKGSVHWMCQRSVWQEHLHLGVEADKYINPRLGEIMRGMPNLLSLGNLLGNYNERALTYDEDALPAIFGLLTVFSRCFTGGFLCGIPEMFFEAALSWRPHWDHIDLRRRIPSDNPKLGQLRPCKLPSWSWVGWEGLVDISQYEAGPANPRAWWIKETIPITEWYTCDSPTSLEKRRIRSSWFETREVYKDSEKPLPPGWTRHAISEAANQGEGKLKDDALLYPDGCDRYIFRHESMSDNNDQEHPWYWPFPVPDIKESTQPFMPEQTSYLSCATHRAHVFAFQAGEGNRATIYSNEDKVIGTLRLHNKEQLQRFPRSDEGWAAAAEVELVAICRTRYYHKTFDEGLRLYTGPIKKWEEYTVLWVEWINKVAYRLAVGQVHKTDWEALELEDINLMLG